MIHSSLLVAALSTYQRIMRGGSSIVVETRLLVRSNCSPFQTSSGRLEVYPSAEDTYILHSDNVTNSIMELESSPCVSEHSVFRVYGRYLRGSTCSDPYLSYQNYIFETNTDLAWSLKGNHETSVMIVDDGIVDHRDLTVDERYPMSSVYFGYHSNSVASVVASRSNDIGLCGVNGDSRIIDINLLASNFISDLSESMAFDNVHSEYNGVYCNSWGPTDDGRCERSGALFDATLRRHISSGRGGLGCIYVFAAGNGGSDENVNDDGYANSPYTIAVAAVHNNGPAYFSEWGSCITVSAPGYQLLSAGSDDSYMYFYGTSASAPIVAGIITILLSTNPALSWRDVQEIIMSSARLVSSGWSFNAAERRYHYALGSGIADAERAARLAEAWIPTTRHVNISQTQYGQVALPAIVVFDIDQDVLVEHSVVCVALTGSASSGAAVGAWIQSPLGTRAILTRPTTRISLIGGCSYDDWCFTSLVQRGEEGRGRWLFYAEYDATLTEDVAFRRARLDILGSTEPFSVHGCRTA